MLRRSLKTKIIVPTILIFVVLLLSIMVFSTIKFSNFVNHLYNEKIEITINELQRFMIDSEHRTKVAAVSISTQRDIVKAIQDDDKKTLLRDLLPLLKYYKVDFCAVTDATGTVLLRTHDPDRFGDSLLELQNIRDALEGKVTTFYEEGTLIRVAVRSGSPVYDRDGVLIGVISTGIRFDTNEAIDNLKKNFGVDFSVTLGETRIASTYFHNGERITGTKINPEFYQAVLADKKPHYFKNFIVFDENYNTYFQPFINSKNEVFAILLLGNSNSKFIAEKNNIIFNEILIGMIGLVVSVTLLYFIITSVLKPIKRLMLLVSEVERGNFNVTIDRTHVAQDEIGSLIYDMDSLFAILKSVILDLSQLIFELNTYNKIDSQIDTKKYSGSYKKIVEDIQVLANSVMDMNKVVRVMDNLDSMVNVVDLDYNIVYVNPTLAKSYHLDIDHCRGQKCYKAIRNYDQPCPICQLPKLLPDKDNYPSLDYEHLYDEMCDKWLSGRASLIRWVDGSLVYFQTLSDETEKKMAQEKLSEAMEAAEAASLAKSAFLANMSHEIRTPLNVIIGIADLQMDDDHLYESLHESFRKISNAGHTLLSIVNDILDISKIESGKFVITPVEYDIASLLNDATMLISSRIGEKPIAFRLNIDKNLPSKLYGDDLRVKQILYNLLGNAIKYTREGTVELGVRCHREDDNIWMEITVTDTGIGIRPEDLKKIFTDYNHINAKANRKVEGTGLGLAITSKLVDSMDGTITVESQFGKGSTFHVRIRQGFVTDVPIGPVVVDNLCQFHYEDNKRTIVNALERVNLSYARVLVVDDLQVNLDVAAGLMRKYQLQVDCVTNGQAAIDRIRLGEPVYNAVFMDHMMPEMDGIEAADRIRALGTTYAQNIPMIALTANAVTGTQELFYEHDFQAFITKPIDVMRLDSVLNEWVKVKSKNQVLNESQTNDRVNIEIPGVDMEKGIEICGGDVELYRAVLRSYADTTPNIIDKLYNVTAESLPDYTIAVHGMKSSSANIGAEAIRHTALSLEEMGRAGNLTGVLAINDAFLKDIESLVKNISDWLEKLVDHSPILYVPERDRALLDRLLQSCENYDFDGVDQLMEELKVANYDEYGDLVTWMSEKINSFDFDEVANRLAEIVGK